MSGVVSKKLKFKGDKVKKKKRSHHSGDRGGGGDDDELAAMAAADPRGWIFPEDVMEITGPSFILLPTEPLTCLAWDAQRQKVFAAPLDIPQAPEGADDLSSAEILQSIEPTDVNQVWVISRLSGSEDVVSLRTSTEVGLRVGWHVEQLPALLIAGPPRVSLLMMLRTSFRGTFLTASPSGTLTASTPSRGVLEAFIPLLQSTSSSSSSSSLFPSISFQTQHNQKYLSASDADAGLSIGKGKAELRVDADEIGEKEVLRVKCQREFVFKARVAAAEARGESKGKKRLFDGGPAEGSLEDEMRRNREAQTWGSGRAVVSDKDRKDLKRAKKEGKLAEAMLDRRAALKSDRYAK